MEQQTVSLKVCISELTHRQIARDGEEFVYLDDKTKVSKEVLDEATLLKAEKERELRVPRAITMRQARLYLLSIGLLDDLENIINQNRAYQIEWEYANQIERESPLVKILGQTLNLDDTAIDNMFMEASKI